MIIQKCRICGLEGEGYEKAKPTDWSFNVCKPCVKEDYAKLAAQVRENQKAGRLEPEPLVICCMYCGESKGQQDFRPSAVASAIGGFLCRCAHCANTRHLWKHLV